MEINRERILALNERFKDYNSNLQLENSITYDQFIDLTKFGTMWNFNFMSSAIWFTENKIDTELIQYLLTIDEEEEYDKYEDALNHIGYRLNAIDNEVFEGRIITHAVLSNYMEALKAHQRVCHVKDMVNRWGYTTYIDINELELVIAECKDINIHTMKKNTGEKTDLKYDGNNIMRNGWMCLEYGLYKEAEYIFKTMFDYGLMVEEVILPLEMTDDGKIIKFEEDKYNVITTLGRLDDLPRYILSVGLALGKAYSAQHKDEIARKTYRKIIETFPMEGSDKYVRFKEVFYWTGHTRIIEAAIELWILDVDNRDTIKKDIIDMFFIMRENFNAPSNNRESVYEQLLVIRMLMDTVFEREEIELKKPARG